MSTSRIHAMTGLSAPGSVGAISLRRYPAATQGCGPPAMLASLQALMWRLRGEARRQSGGPPEPPKPAERESYWDDPALWMLMLH